MTRLMHMSGWLLCNSHPLCTRTCSALERELASCHVMQQRASDTGEPGSPSHSGRGHEPRGVGALAHGRQAGRDKYDG